jgi:CRISPR/Cas system-associated exonuclease Cas4 (RecB family)
MEPELVEKIKQWLLIDAEINEINNSLKEKKRVKKGLTDYLMETMKTKEIEVVNLNDGSIEIKKRKSKKPLNEAQLVTILQQYYGEEDVSVEKVTEIVKHILNNRVEQESEVLKRTVSSK